MSAGAVQWASAAAAAAVPGQQWPLCAPVISLYTS